MKTLRVCLSSDLPGLLDRNPDYLYFLYDKLFLYSGQNMIDVNFVITERIPDIDDQVSELIYILNTDGSVHRKIDYVDTVVAEIEEDSQIELLRKAGTMYYVNSDHRYMDSQRRTLTLPYNDGNYDLVMFDEDRIGEYSLGKDTSDMVTVDSRLYLNGIGEGQYRLIGSDLKELDFEIYEDSVSSNIRINRKTRSNYKEFESIATLILTFSTGIIRTPYVLILGLILLITILGLLLRRKKVQE